MLTFDLQGHIAIVTGAGKNLGRATAIELASAGAAVACTYHHDENAAHEVCEEIRNAGGTALPLQLDLSEVASIRTMVEQVTTQLGQPDILISNAAMRPRSSIEDVTVEEWDLVHSTNLRGPFFLAQAVIPGMRERSWGRIINIGGIDAYWGNPRRPHVVATKLGIVGLGRALANETARWGITVNTVVPGTMDTKREHPEWYADLGALYQERMDRTPQARLGKPTDIASACLFLASHHAGYITGQELLVTGGAYPLVRQPSGEY